VSIEIELDEPVKVWIVSETQPDGRCEIVDNKFYWDECDAHSRRDELEASKGEGSFSMFEVDELEES
jgi:hypothetical protein